MNERKPPLGLTPKYIWDSQRLFDIINAIHRYAQAEKPVPGEWVDELRILCIKLTTRD